MSFEEHAVHKQVLSLEDSFPERQAARERLIALDDENINEILGIEIEARGSVTSEPKSLPCRAGPAS